MYMLLMYSREHTLKIWESRFEMYLDPSQWLPYEGLEYMPESSLKREKRVEGRRNVWKTTWTLHKDGSQLSMGLMTLMRTSLKIGAPSAISSLRIVNAASRRKWPRKYIGRMNNVGVVTEVLECVVVSLVQQKCERYVSSVLQPKWTQPFSQIQKNVVVNYPVVSIRVSTIPTIAQLRWNHTPTSQNPTFASGLGVISHGRFSLPLLKASTYSWVGWWLFGP